MRLQHVCAVLCFAALASGCELTSPASIAGTYVATSFVVTETGQAPVNVLAAGGSLTITIAENNATVGSLTLPGSLVGGSDITLSMDGTAVRTNDTVQFQQSEDSFVRDITWMIHGNMLHGTLTNAGVTVEVALTRQ